MRRRRRGLAVVPERAEGKDAGQALLHLLLRDLSAEGLGVSRLARTQTKLRRM